MENKVIEEFQKINKRRQDDEVFITPLVMFAEAWDLKQQEVNELRFKLEVAEKNLNNAFKTIEFEQKYQNEILKRIDKALDLIYSEKSKVECGVYEGLNADLIIGIGYDLHLILTGETKCP